MSSSFNARSALALASLSLSAALGCDRPPESTAGWAERATADDAPANAAATNMAPACGKKSAATGVLARKVNVFGKARTYTLVVPAGYDAAISQPLVYVLHGDGGTGKQIRASFDVEAAAGGKALFLYPDGAGGAWDLDSPASKNADVALFDATLAQVQSEYCVDLHRVFIAGFSKGAYMANQLACRRGDRIRAVATHSGGGPYGAEGGTYDDHGELVCSGKPVGSLVLHGTSDAVVAPSEGEKSIAHWTHANHCASSTTSGTCATYTGCANPVVACKIHGLGHTVWPEAPKRVWQFFDSQR